MTTFDGSLMSCDDGKSSEDILLADILEHSSRNLEINLLEESN